MSVSEAPPTSADALESLATQPRVTGDTHPPPTESPNGITQTAQNSETATATDTTSSPSTSQPSPVNYSLKRPRSTEPVTQFLSASRLDEANGGTSKADAPAVVATPAAASVVEGHHSSGSEPAEVGIPPRQVRLEGSTADSSSTPRSPYANLPRKLARKTPVSTPTSSLGTPISVSPVTLGSGLTSPSLSTAPPAPATTPSAAAKHAAVHQRWATLLHGVLMKERAPHEAERVRELSARIVAAIPGDLEQMKDGFQTLLFGLKDVKNVELRRKVVEGELLVERLVRMDDRELANPDLRKQIEEKMEDRARDTNLSELSKAMRTSNSTLFKCKACGARDTSWYQRQTRSGDEPMTLIITCNRCNTQWRQY